MRDNGVEDLADEGPKHDGLVLYRIDDVATSGLNEASADGVNCGNGDDEAVLARACALHFAQQLLLDRVEQSRSEVARMQQNVLLQ